MFVPAIGGQLRHSCRAFVSPLWLGLCRRRWIAGLAFIRQSVSEGVLADINVSFRF